MNRSTFAGIVPKIGSSDAYRNTFARLVPRTDSRDAYRNTSAGSVPETGSQDRSKRSLQDDDRITFTGFVPGKGPWEMNRNTFAGIVPKIGSSDKTGTPSQVLFPKLDLRTVTKEVSGTMTGTLLGILCPGRLQGDESEHLRRDCSQNRLQRQIRNTIPDSVPGKRSKGANRITFAVFVPRKGFRGLNGPWLGIMNRLWRYRVEGFWISVCLKHCNRNASSWPYRFWRFCPKSRAKVDRIVCSTER